MFEFLVRRDNPDNDVDVDLPGAVDCGVVDIEPVGASYQSNRKLEQCNRLPTAWFSANLNRIQVKWKCKSYDDHTPPPIYNLIDQVASFPSNCGRGPGIRACGKGGW